MTWTPAPTGPSDRAAAGGSPVRPPPSLRYGHWHATTPTPPFCTLRCISPCCEPASLTVFMWASFRVLTLSPLSVKSMQPYSDPLRLLPNDGFVAYKVVTLFKVKGILVHEISLCGRRVVRK